MYDSKTSATLIRQQINTLGTPHDNLDISSSYQDAIKQVAKRFYDILILDYHLDQCINGNELASLLNKKKLLSRQTGIILISGDSRQEMVLTLSPNINSSIQNNTLGLKILSVREDLRAISQGQGLISKQKFNPFEKVYDLGLLIDSSRSPIILESNLLENFKDEERWELLSMMLKRSLTLMHTAKFSALASEYYHQGLTQQAIERLKNHFTINHLAHKVIFKLVKIYVQINSSACLVAIGKTFAKNVSIIDASWISGVIRYRDCIVAQLNKQPSASEQKKLVQCINHFFILIKQRLTSSQRPYLTCFIYLFATCLQIFQSNHADAHQLLFKAVTPHYCSFYKMPTILLTYIVPLAEEFSEIWLSESLLTIAKGRNQVDK